MSNIITIVRSSVAHVRAGQRAHAAYMSTVEQLRAALPRHVLADVELVRDALLVPACDAYGVPTKVAESSGKTMMDSKHKEAANARQYISRTAKAIVGASSAAKAEPKAMRFNAQQKSAAQALLDACGGDVARARALLKALG